MKSKLKKLDIYDIMKRILVLVIFFNIYSKYKSNVFMLIFTLSIFSIVILNDYLRINDVYKKRRTDIISYIFSIILLSILTVCAWGYVFIYYYANIWELFYYYNKNYRALSIFHFSSYVISITTRLILSYGTNIFSEGMVLDIIMLCFWYLSTAGMIYYMKKQTDEKQKVKKLNEELIDANKKLEKYSREVELLSIKNERNRMAGEMHDSLGHSLTALIMQLEYVDKIIENNPQKAKEILNKSQNLARESMSELRKTVYSLKEDTENELIYSINKLISNIISTDKIKFHFKYSENVENLLSDVKNLLYRTIKESITNSIRHGQATEINIEIHHKENEIQLILEDNGIGCGQIIKGNGIKGIIDRIDKIGGESKFISSTNQGFRTEISIPVYGDSSSRLTKQ